MTREKNLLILLSLILSSFIYSQTSENGLFCKVEGHKADSAHLCQPAQLNAKKQLKVLGNKGKFYVFWGYHRGFHSRTDTTFHTEDGTFTIKSSKGNDRPSTKFKSYLSATVPQFNLRVGYFISDRWALEFGTDHMKWVFDKSLSYEIEGDYQREVWVGGERVSFDTAKERRDARFIDFEHSDGYNYIHFSAQYNFPIFLSHNRNWSLIGSFGGGLGGFIPKTRVQIFDQDENTPRDVDNKFQLAGYGAHINGRLRLEYKGFYLQGGTRNVLGKINNAPFLGDQGRISQAPILSTQLIFGGGAKFDLFTGKNKAKRQRGQK